MVVITIINGIRKSACVQEIEAMRERGKTYSKNLTNKQPASQRYALHDATKKKKKNIHTIKMGKMDFDNRKTYVNR